jgi:crotonobetainyl-CoA:carnitine CoA-transferase CaiB-like acyl-CoA transferase
MPGPLDGIRVLDLTSVVLGPLATQTMGDMGADIVKIEGPAGDTTRYTGPKRSADMSALYMGLNRNKRSLVLDLKQAAAKDALWRLIDTADVFLHSVRPQAMERLGFGQDAVRARNTRIVYAGIHGFRMDGPYAGRPAYDDVIQGLSGSADLMARLVGEPRYMPTIMADKTCGLVAVNAVLAALLERERSGRGQFVEIPMFESMVAFNMADHIFGYTFDPPEGPMGYSRVLTPSRRPYKTTDGYICLLAYTDIQWVRFWEEVGRPDLKDDPRFDSPRQPRRQYRGRLQSRGRLHCHALHRRVAGGSAAAGDPLRRNRRAGRHPQRSAPAGGRLFPAGNAPDRRRDHRARYPGAVQPHAGIHRPVAAEARRAQRRDPA